MAAPMSRAAMKQWLQAVPLFSTLSDDEHEMLASTARSITVKKNARVFGEGDQANCCFVLTSGIARVVIGGWGDAEVVLAVLKPPSLVGEIGLFNRSTRSASLVATNDCHLIQIPAASFAELRKNPHFEDRIVSHIISTLLAANDQVRVLSATSVMTRLAACLSRIARQEGQRDGTSSVISRRKHQELADQIACSRETVSRKLETLKRRKCVSWDKSTMRLDVERLQRYLHAEFGVF